LREALGRYRDEKTVHKAVLRACDKPGIKNVRLRDLRHEATSKLLREGPSAVEVASMTGHRTPNTLKRYCPPAGIDDSPPE